jgi:hypothetical protein
LKSQERLFRGIPGFENRETWGTRLTRRCSFRCSNIFTPTLRKVREGWGTRLSRLRQRDQKPRPPALMLKNNRCSCDVVPLFISTEILWVCQRRPGDRCSPLLKDKTYRLQNPRTVKILSGKRVEQNFVSRTNAVKRYTYRGSRVGVCWRYYDDQFSVRLVRRANFEPDYVAHAICGPTTPRQNQEGDKHQEQGTTCAQDRNSD